MYGSTLTRSVNGVMHMLRRPYHAVKWWENLLTAKEPIDAGLPWISWPSIDYLKGNVKSGSEVLEYGGGGSTIFFAGLGCKVTTVESSEVWVSRIDSRLRELGMADLVQLHPSPVVNSFGRLAYVRVAQQTFWDVVLVDGLLDTRVDCVQNCRDRIRPGGLLILDDAWRREYVEVPALLKDFHRIEFVGLGPARLGVTKTDVYIAPMRYPNGHGHS